VTVSDTSAGAVTVKTVLPLTVPEVPVIVLVPCPLLMAMPVPSMVATLVDDELQITDERLLVLVSE
jgi:hypothetical protein